MKKLLITLLLPFVLLLSCIGQPKETFPVAEVCPKLENSQNPKIAVFMPSVSDSTEYASMIVQAFKNYFVDKLAFNPADRPNADIDIFLVTGKQRPSIVKPKDFTPNLLFGMDNREAVLNNLFDTTGMYTCQVEDSVFSQLSIPLIEDYNASSTLFLLDRDNSILWRDDDYRGQGEHLKPLEYKVKNLMGITVPVPQTNGKEIKVGDTLSQEILIEGKEISEYKGEILVFTFYPAAYSGVFDIESMVRRISDQRLAMMSCAVQISSLDKMSMLANSGVHYFAISESTAEILNNWKSALGTHHIQYLNDADYSLAGAFGAYSPEGYCSRVTVIVGKDGKIAYIDRDYTLDKEPEIQAVVQNLISHSK
jgi:peroxiredoxin